MNKIILNCHECLATTRKECICSERCAVETIQKWGRRYLVRTQNSKKRSRIYAKPIWGANGRAKPNEEGWELVF